MESVIKKKRVQKTAFSLMELLVVMVIIASLVALAIPAIKTMQKSFDSTGAEGMISAALATARTIAMSQQRYAGVRFQKAGDPNNALKANQYMIFIIYDSEKTNLVCGFIAVEGYKPIKLPENMGVMDMRLDDSADIASDGQINSTVAITDTTSFSIVFSPAGKLVIHDVRTRNKNGKSQPATLAQSDDDVFNSPENIINNNTGQFVQDDYSTLGLDKEQSRNKFVIYDCEKFSKLDPAKRHSTYLKDLNFVYINPYTGEIIK